MRVLALILSAALPATAEDLVFQAPEPDTILVVHADPELGNELALLLKKGSVEKKWLVADVLEAGELRVDGGKVQWLAPVGSRVLREGVELRLASGRRVVLRFDGAGPPQKPRPVPVAELTCPCSYTDDEGVYHLVGAAADVPPKYRVRAAPVRSDAVQVIPMPPPPASPEGPAEEAPRRQASAQPTPPRPREQRPQMDYYEYIRRITGQRGPQYRVNCIGNDGKPMPCTWLEPYIIRY